MPTLLQARQWYRLNDPVHGFHHITRVYQIAERIAKAEGADIEIVRAAALLHDVEGNSVNEGRLEHQHASAQFASLILLEEGWSEERVSAVIHCIRAHRFRDQSEPPQTIEAKVLFDADKLDAIGAIGAVRAIAYAVLDQQDLFAKPSKRFLETAQKEPGEAHSPYHEYLYKLKKLKDQMFTKTGRELAFERHTFLEGFFNQLLAELAGER